MACSRDNWKWRNAGMRQRRAAEGRRRKKRAKEWNSNGPVGALSVPLMTGAILEAVLPLKTTNSP